MTRSITYLLMLVKAFRARGMVEDARRVDTLIDILTEAMIG